MAIHADPGDLLLVEVEPQGYRIESAALGTQAIEAADVLVLDGDQAPQLLDGGGAVLDLLQGHIQGVGGEIVREHDPLGVIDQPAGRRQGLELDPVLLGQRGEVRVVGDLELGQTRQHHRQGHHHQHGRP